MNWIKKIFEVKEIITPIKDTVIEHSNGVKINYSLYGRVLAAKKNKDEITHYPLFFNKNNNINMI